MTENVDSLVFVGLLLVIFWLTFLLIRLRLELWANRRVIAAFGRVEPKVGKKSNRLLSNSLAWGILILVIAQLISKLL